MYCFISGKKQSSSIIKIPVLVTSPLVSPSLEEVHFIPLEFVLVKVVFTKGTHTRTQVIKSCGGLEHLSLRLPGSVIAPAYHTSTITRRLPRRPSHEVEVGSHKSRALECPVGTSACESPQIKYQMSISSSSLSGRLGTS